MAIEIRLPNDQPQNWMAILCLLYKPLVGNEAVLLYETLTSLAMVNRNAQTTIEEEQLITLLQTTRTSLTTNRVRLEKFDLVRSFENQEKELVRIVLCPTKTAQDFLSDEVLRRLLYQSVEREGVRQLQSIFEVQPVKEPEEELTEVTQVLDLSHFEQNWTVQKEEDLGSANMDWSSSREYDFDWDVFFRNMHRTLPSRLRTRQNLNRIAYLANVYGVDEETMRRLVIRHLRDKRTWIDFDALINDLGTTTKVVEGKPDDYSQSPVSFLKAHQPGNAKVLPKERSLLLSLAKTHEFSNELINTIVEYSMEQCQGSLVEKYVRTLANNMARAHIETRDQALEYFSRTKKAVSSSKSSKAGPPEQANLPDWYDIIPTEKGTKEEVEAILALQKQVLGNGSSDSDTPASLDELDPLALLGQEDQSDQSDQPADSSDKDEQNAEPLWFE